MNAYRPVCCSFCGAPRDEVDHMITSESGAAICDGCVGIAVIAIEEAEDELPPVYLH